MHIGRWKLCSALSNQFCCLPWEGNQEDPHFVFRLRPKVFQGVACHRPVDQRSGCINLQTITISCSRLTNTLNRELMKTLPFFTHPNFPKSFTSVGIFLDFGIFHLRIILNMKVSMKQLTRKIRLVQRRFVNNKPQENWFGLETRLLFYKTGD